MSLLAQMLYIPQSWESLLFRGEIAMECHAVTYDIYDNSAAQNHCLFREAGASEHLTRKRLRNVTTTQHQLSSAFLVGRLNSPFNGRQM